MKVAAVQLNAVFADVQANIGKIKIFIKQAAKNGVELILFPEFFTSAVGFSKKMLDVAIQDKKVQIIIKQLSKEYNIIIGGSYLMFDGQNAFNIFELVFPNGQIFSHKKDIPTQLENCYYTDGDENHILNTPIGSIGVALCWEMIRYDTINRISQKADIILAGSCWWDLPNDALPEREPLRQYNRQLALQTPVTLAKMLNVPVIHSNHCGKVVAFNFPYEDKLQVRQLVGAAQMIDADGNVIARRCFNEGEGMIISDFSWDTSNRREAGIHSEKYWIPDLPDSYINAWKNMNPKGKAYYQKVSLPYYKNNVK